MPGGNHARVRRNGWLAVVAVACLLAGVLAWSLDALLSKDTPAEHRPSRSAAGGAASHSPTASPRQVDRRAVERCATDLARAGKILAAARPGVRHWHAHVQARTDALAGRITVRRMNRIFDRTRLGGDEDQRKYLKARHRFSGPLRCQLTPEAPDAPKRVVDCIRRAEAMQTALTATDRTLADWRRHLRRMAAFRHGGMNAHRAQHLWVIAWRTAPINIVAYKRAVARLAAAPPCRPTAG
jgi:hypothetical protein